MKLLKLIGGRLQGRTVGRISSLAGDELLIGVGTKAPFFFNDEAIEEKKWNRSDRLFR